MVASVEKHKGFYVGRYETGNLSQSTVVSIRGSTDIGSQTWYRMYKKQKDLYSTSDAVVSSMIWGCQFDQMLKVIYASDNTKSLTDSSSWGNYYNVTFTYEDNGTKTKNVNTGTLIPTGSTERNKVYNIYDVAGNVDDLTIETAGVNARSKRGRLLQL